MQSARRSSDARRRACRVAVGALLCTMEPNRVLVTGATPGATVTLYAGSTPGQSLVPGCPGIVVGIADAIARGETVAGQRGSAVRRVFVPGSAAGTTAIAQAVEGSACTVSDLLMRTFAAAPSGP